MSLPKEPNAEFPWGAMVSLSIGMLAHSVVFTCPMPFVAYMIVDFQLSDSIDTAGYYAGYITGSFMVGRTIMGIPWGILADTIGRKSCLLMSMFNVAIIGVLFGFSMSFEMAIISRLLIGLGNGYMGICKTCITEIVSTKEHELKGFGIINGIWGLGMIVGPFFGGVLSRPAIQYPDLFPIDSIWGRFPYLLPCVCCASFAVLAFIGILIYLPETLLTKPSSSSTKVISFDDQSTPVIHKTTNRIGWLKAIMNSVLSKDNKTDREGNFYNQVNINSSHGMLTTEDDDISSIELSSISTSSLTTLDEINENKDLNDDVELSKQLPNSFREKQSIVIKPISTANELDIVKPSSLYQIISNKEIQFLLVIYLCFCFMVTFVDESVPLWCVTSRERGGLKSTSSQVGELLGFIGLTLIIFQIFLYDYVITKYFNFKPSVTLYRLSFIAAIGLLSVPFISTLGLYLSDLISNLYAKQFITQLLLLCSLVIFRIPAVSAFSTLAILTNDAVAMEMRGTINGLVMTAGSLGNAMGPIVGSIVYAVLVQSPNPIDGRDIFIIAAILMAVFSYICKRCWMMSE